MRILTAAMLVSAATAAQAQVRSTPVDTVPRSSVGQQERLAPTMAQYTTEILFGDRLAAIATVAAVTGSLVTISVLIATGKTGQLESHLSRALGNGVLPREASGVLSHLAIYAGWPSAVSALDVYDRVFAARRVDTAGIRAVLPPLPPLADSATDARAVDEQFGIVAPKFAQLTKDVVFENLWRRPELTLRDRSLVTIAALAAMGDDEDLDFYLRRGLKAGLTHDQITEAFTHLAFYAGWSKATMAMRHITRLKR